MHREVEGAKFDVASMDHVQKELFWVAFTKVVKGIVAYHDKRVSLNSAPLLLDVSTKLIVPALLISFF